MNNNTNHISSRGCLCVSNDAADTHFCKLDESCKLHVIDWLKNTPVSEVIPLLVEVRFKNTRKGFFRNVNEIGLKVGDIIAVEASPGHDIGIVSLTGELVYEQMRRIGVDPGSNDFKKIYRKAKSTDIEKWNEAINLENTTMLRSRKIASELNLDMKIGDVEYQGDKTKAIFYYIAEDRVDFRELIKLLAEQFKVRIEMKQIGARQEAGRIGGLGSCGRELCCSSWLVNFVSVSTGAAKMQELSLNPKKLAGQCIKLKCCLNFELDAYMDERKDFPDHSITLETQQGIAHHFKTDVHRRLMWYGFNLHNDEPLNLIPVPIERVKEVITLNKKGIKIKQLIENIDIQPSIQNKPEELKFLANAEPLQVLLKNKPNQEQSASAPKVQKNTEPYNKKKHFNNRNKREK